MNAFSQQALTHQYPYKVQVMKDKLTENSYEALIRSMCNEHGARPDHRTLVDHNAIPSARSHLHPGSCTNLHSSCQLDTYPKMSKVAEDGIMINRRVSIDDSCNTNTCIGANDCTRHYSRSTTQHCRGADPSTWMDDRN